MGHPSIDRIGAVAALGLHVAAGVALLAYQPSRDALFSAAPIMVSLIAPQAVAPQPQPRTEAQPPKPRAVARPAPRPPELQPAPVRQPAPAAAAPATEPPSVLEAAQTTGPESLPAPQPIVAVAPPAAEFTPPVFNADYLDNPAPAYPLISRRLGEQGRVLLRVRVGTGGQAELIEVHGSSGFARLDDAARDTVRRWRFAPARRGDAPVPAWVLIPISFRLDG
jgi:protein TonB